MSEADGQDISGEDVKHFLEANGDKTRIQVLIEKLPFTNHLLLKKLINTLINEDSELT